MPHIPNSFLVLFVFVASLALAGSTQAQEPASCKALANEIVKTGVEDVLKKLLQDKPELRNMGQKELVRKAGRQFLTAERPDFKAYGYMMLLWFGSKEERNLVSRTAGKLSTPADRAHFYFVLGLYQIGSKEPKVAATGRNYIQQMRDSRLVTFVNDAMWDQLISKCRLAT